MYSFVVGIDISKLTLDAVLLRDGKKESALYQYLNNTVEDIEKLFKSFSKVSNFSLDKRLICVESTGVYTYPLLSFVAQNSANI